MIAYIVSRNPWRRCRFKGGGSSSSTTTNNYTTFEAYKPSEAEQELAKLQADYARTTMPNAYYLNDKANEILKGSIGEEQMGEIRDLNKTALRQIANAQQGNIGLAQGQLPTAYTQNMADALRTGVSNTVGSNINNLAQRGILNSSVTNKALNDISANVSDVMANNYTNNINTVSGLNNNVIGNAGQAVQQTAAAQEAAQNPALRLWNASLMQSQPTSTAFGMVKGNGVTTGGGNSTSTTQKNWSQSGNGFGSFINGAASIAGGVAPFIPRKG